MAALYISKKNGNVFQDTFYEANFKVNYIGGANNSSSLNNTSSLRESEFPRPPIAQEEYNELQFPSPLMHKLVMQCTLFINFMKNLMKS